VTNLCARCKEALPPLRADSYCRGCRRLVSKEWRARRPGTVAAYKPKAVAKRAERRLADPEGVARRERARALRKRYGISEAIYESMLLEQGGCCAICGSSDSGRKGTPGLHVDHDHASGSVRALLCNQCNAVLGYAKDSSDRLRNAAQYLDFHAGRRRAA
jgi:recombination endonuclease VII